MSPAFFDAFCKRHISIRNVQGKSLNQNFTHVHGVATSRLLAGVTLGKGPEKGVGETVLAEVAHALLLDLESREVG